MPVTALRAGSVRTIADSTPPGSATLCAVIAAGAFVLPPDGRAAPSSSAHATGDWPAQFARCGASAADVLPDTGQVEFRFQASSGQK